ncbi:hypothetical protein NQ317_002632 [Molorchus minor]|uniref:Reverse transcriptase N-terminal domain-containing protein n=1 Tax=Molorchus minor TaxID=1323400 RepID=A0ABQ9JBE4_9CUCU|nr:hypothetical protein NQ317_002632 [Molorchus minor]
MTHPKKLIKNNRKPHDRNRVKLSQELIAETKKLKQLNWYRKTSPSEDIHNKYKVLKKEISKKIENEKINHYWYLINSAENKNKKLWELVNLKLDKKKIYSSKINLNLNGSVTSDCKEIANAFGQYFFFVHKRSERHQKIYTNSNNTNLSISKSTKFLGTCIDSLMSWNEHIDSVCAKLNKSYFALSTLKNTLNEESLLNFYCATVYSTISYNIITWGQATEHSRVFILQKRIIRLLFSLTYTESCRPTFKSKNLLTVTGIYIMKLMIFIHNKKGNLKKFSDIHSYSTRNNNNIYMEKFSHVYHKRSPYHAGIFYYNMFPTELKKYNLTKHFLKLS